MWRVVDARGVTTTITAECVIPGGDHTSARWRFTYDEGKASADVDADDDTNPREALCVWAGYQVTEIRGPGEATTAEQLADMAAKLDAARDQLAAVTVDAVTAERARDEAQARAEGRALVCRGCAGTGSLDGVLCGDCHGAGVVS